MKTYPQNEKGWLRSVPPKGDNTTHTRVEPSEEVSGTRQASGTDGPAWMLGGREEHERTIADLLDALRFYATAVYPDDGSGRPSEAFQKRAKQAIARAEGRDQ